MLLYISIVGTLNGRYVDDMLILPVFIIYTKKQQPAMHRQVPPISRSTRGREKKRLRRPRVKNKICSRLTNSPVMNPKLNSARPSPAQPPSPLMQHHHRNQQTSPRSSTSSCTMSNKIILLTPYSGYTSDESACRYPKRPTDNECPKHFGRSTKSTIACPSSLLFSHSRDYTLCVHIPCCRMRTRGGLPCLETGFVAFRIWANQVDSM
jgi:hypothetical protein